MTEFLLYIYIYSFIGWVYESAYSSIRERRWINRGFMHGPFLTIYGMGGIICVQSAILAGGDALKTFMYAFVICTAMELSTGLLMEKLFKVRYWDYTQVPLNIKGYVCFPVSMFWGICAVFIYKYIQAPISNAVSYIEPNYLEVFVYALTIACAIDFTVSFVEATDLKNMLEDIDVRNKKIEELKYKLEKVKDVLSVDTSKLKGFTADVRDSLNESQKSLDASMEDYYNSQRDFIENIRARIRELPEMKEIMQETLKSLNNTQKLMRSRFTLRSKGVKSMLGRNPRISSIQYKEILDMIKKMGE
ncbi:MAG: hypothetical protein GX078_07800 [Clostridiales bacterium]|nr:hypothetical protein [Clostridiales bacterium]